MEEIQDARIDGGDLSRPMVAENVIDVFQGLGAIPPPHAVVRVQGFFCVRVVEGEASHGESNTIDGSEGGNGGESRDSRQGPQLEKFTAIDLPTIHDTPGNGDSPLAVD